MILTVLAISGFSTLISLDLHDIAFRFAFASHLFNPREPNGTFADGEDGGGAVAGGAPRERSKGRP